MPAGFGYYKAHTIAGSADGALTDFQVRVTAYKGSGTDSGEAVYLGTHVENDFDDVRFTSDDGGTELNYWKDQSTLVSGTSCSFWVEVPSIPAASGSVDIRVYYGNAAAVDASDIKATMLGGDDFRTLRRTHQVASGATQLWGTGICHIGGVIYMTVWDGDDVSHTLYKTTDGGVTAPTSVSAIYAASSARSHSNIATDGGTNFYVTSKHASAHNALYLKKSTDTGASWGSEVTIASGLTAVTDPTPLYVSSSLLLVFVRVDTGSDFAIRCYESTDDGASFSLKNTVHTETKTGINSLEDIDAVRLSSGRILVAWEREVTEVSTASCRMRYSDDDGATWSSESTIVSNGTGIDDEGGSFAMRSNGTLDYFFGSNVNGGASYVNSQMWRTTYTEGSNTWATPVLVNESYNGVENNVQYDANDIPVALCTRQYGVAGTTSTYVLTMTRIEPDDLSDRSITQDRGIAYALVGGLWVEGSLLDASETRGFAAIGDYAGGDAVVELLASAPSPLTEVDIRCVMRYGSVSDHYLLSLTNGSGVNKLQWYKRVSGAYTLLHDAAITPALNTLYRIVCQMRGTNPTTLTVTVNGSTIFSSLTEATSSQTTGKIGIASSGTAGRRATLARHMFARKYTANEPAHGAWGTETAVLTIDVTPGAYTLTGQSVGLNASRSLSVTPGSYSVTGADVGLAAARALAVTPGAYAITGQAVILAASRTLAVTPGSYALTGQSVGLGAARLLNVTAGAYALTGNSVELTYTQLGSYSLDVTPGAYAISGSAVGLATTRALSVAPGAYSITGAAVDFSVGRALDVTPGSYAITGQDVAFARALRLSVTTGVYALTGSDVTLTYGAEAADTIASMTFKFAMRSMGFSMPMRSMTITIQ